MISFLQQSEGDPISIPHQNICNQSRIDRGAANVFILTIETIVMLFNKEENYSAYIPSIHEFWSRNMEEGNTYSMIYGESFHTRHKMTLFFFNLFAQIDVPLN